MQGGQAKRPRSPGSHAGPGPRASRLILSRTHRQPPGLCEGAQEAQAGLQGAGCPSAGSRDCPPTAPLPARDDIPTLLSKETCFQAFYRFTCIMRSGCLFSPFLREGKEAGGGATLELGAEQLGGNGNPMPHAVGPSSLFQGRDFLKSLERLAASGTEGRGPDPGGLRTISYLNGCVLEGTRDIPHCDQKPPAWVAQRVSAAFSPGRDPGDPGSSPTSGSLRRACFSLCLCLCLSLSLSLSLMNK